MKRVTKKIIWRQDKLLLGVLAISMALAVTIVSCTKEDEVQITPDEYAVHQVAGSAIKSLFMAAGAGATSGIVSTSTGWLLGALGLSDNSPDYTEELSKINQSLQVIIGQLEGMQEQLAEINLKLQELSCSLIQTSLTDQTGRIKHLAALYSGYFTTIENGGRITNTTISNWVDQVLAEGQYTSQMPMGQILTTMGNLLVQPQSGAVRECVAALAQPGDDTFDDTDYYFNVVQFTNYYYYYQALGLMLLNEAYHYKAWNVAELENGDIYSSDSVSAVCSDVNAMLYCTKAATYTNIVYNALIEQFTIAGAPYTDYEFLIQNHSTQPKLWVKALEDFSAVAGDNCSYPLNSFNNRCGITVGPYDGGNNNIKDVVFNTYSDWDIADAADLNILLSGWTQGKAGPYLHGLGFRNMQNKIIITPNTTSVSLRNSGSNQTVTLFIDGNTSKDWIDNKLFDNSNAFNYIMDVWKTVAQGSCAPFASNYYTYNGKAAGGTSCGWYIGSWGLAEWCGGHLLYGGIQWGSYKPSWMNNSNNRNQFRLLHTEVNTFNCTENRIPRNAGNVWTMCGDDFTDWFEINVPRPATCDIPGAGGVPCNL